ncbi:uncharacterized protein LOC130761155 [Actinidia eriantha]|uniref:uncharacterized protein LOC130761155 n=1 Tax=Actinidia eriantha TaxID=165200 RepID=UPI00258DF50B|nr:uncharacterized protein LOC130761155 [Actinidia eriantha]
MAAEEEKRSDFYGVLGLKKECSAAELRNAYKKLALRWHPDRCSASGNSKYVEEAKKKFQAIQEAYSVLSDANKRFMYDVGVYDCDDDENGMGDFLNEMAVMMTQNMSNKKGEESFEELQELFEEMFQSEAFGSTSQNVTPNSFSRSSYTSCNTSNKRDSFEMNSGKAKNGDSSSFDIHFEGFCMGAEHHQNPTGKEARRGIPRGAGNRRHGRKQKVSSGHDISSSANSHISA